MKKLAVINGINVGFEVVGEQTFATSLDIAAVFEKRHDNIIAQIRALPQDEFRNLNFKETHRTAKFGAVMRSEPYYNLTRDGFSLLVMGFTGEKAYKFKVEFIKIFNEMEKYLKKQNFANLDLIDELKNANIIKDEFKIQNDNLKDELLEVQRKLLSFYQTQNSRFYKLDDKIKELKAKGFGATKISHILGVSRQTIYNYIKEIL